MKTRAGKNSSFLDLEKAGIEFKKKLERSKKFPEISGLFQIAGITFHKGTTVIV